MAHNNGRTNLHNLLYCFVFNEEEQTGETVNVYYNLLPGEELHCIASL